MSKEDEFLRELAMLNFPRTFERQWRDAEALAKRYEVTLHSNSEYGCRGEGFNSPNYTRLKRDVLEKLAANET